MTIPRVFSGKGERAIVSFDWVDIASGTGYETYYFIESEDNGGKDYHLTSQRDFSNSTKLTVSTSTEDHDYDLSAFSLPRTIKGTALISLAIDGDSGATFTSIVELYKWDGSSETQIGSTVTLASVLSAPKMAYLEMDVPQTHFKAGETLRVRLSYGVPGASAGRIGIDPANRTDGDLAITTTSKIHIPYRIDL